MMSHHEMSAQKTVHLSMAEIKEIDFHLEKSVQDIRHQIEQAEVSQKPLLREKADFLEQIMAKINS